MPNIVVTSTTNSIKVEFNDLSSTVGYSKGTWRKEQLHFQLHSNYVKVINGGDFEVTWNGTGGMQIDSVNAVAPTSNSDLYDKLIALIA